MLRMCCALISGKPGIAVFWIYLRFSPPSQQWWFSFCGSADTKLLRWASSRAFHRSSSELVSKGSRFILKELENNTGSWEWQWHKLTVCHYHHPLDFWWQYSSCPSSMTIIISWKSHWSTLQNVWDTRFDYCAETCTIGLGLPLWGGGNTTMTRTWINKTQ